MWSDVKFVVIIRNPTITDTIRILCLTIKNFHNVIHLLALFSFSNNNSTLSMNSFRICFRMLCDMYLISPQYPLLISRSAPLLSCVICPLIDIPPLSVKFPAILLKSHRAKLFTFWIGYYRFYLLNTIAFNHWGLWLPLIVNLALGNV